MSARRVACPTSWGQDHDLVVLQGHVVVPRELGHMSALSWLSDEEHGHLAVTALSALERETGAELGLSPYCVPVERWNRAASEDPWLPIVPAVSLDSPAVAGHGTAEPRHTRDGLRSLPMPVRTYSSLDNAAEDSHSHIGALDRLRCGSAAVGCLFGGIREAMRVGIHSAAVLACAYYLVAAALWLWGLRDGMDGNETQGGVALVVVAAILAAATGHLAEHSTGTGRGAARLRSDGRERQPLVYTMLDAYRLGIALQLLAFGAFVMF